MSRAYLRTRLEALRSVVAERLLAGDRDRMTDPLRGVRITADELRRELARGDPAVGGPLADLAAEMADQVAAVLDAVPPGQQPALHRLARRVGLDDVDEALLVVAAAPDLDRRFERLFGFLNDDVSLRRATVGLALDLTGLDRDDPAGRGRLLGARPLVELGLVEVGGADRPALSRALTVPDGVLDALLGGTAVDAGVLTRLRRRTPDPAAAPPPLVAALRAGRRLLHCREVAGADGTADACDAIAAAGGTALPVEVQADDAAAVAAVVREAALRGLVPVVRLAGATGATPRRALARLIHLPWSVVIVTPEPWDPGWSDVVPSRHEATPLDWPDRERTWDAALRAVPHEVDDLATAAGAFRLTAHQIRRAVAGAADVAAIDGRAVRPADLREHARAENDGALERVAVRVHPRAGWDDLVLRHDQRERLREVVVRSHHGGLVLDQWGMGRGTRRRGIVSLFAGPPGTGKTMAAEVVAATLGLDLYVINLATVIDKYIGETEKNLERVFAAAAGVNGVLFFDEADALFGKRSEVKDARDRYANVETAYLLQRLERFEGTAILATNLKANLDEAFSRRIDVFVDFPMPEPDERKRIWTSALGRDLPCAEDIDVDFLAQAFELGGGNIVNVVVTAAFMVADRGGEVTMADLVRATGREYHKLGRLCSAAEFGPHLTLVERDLRGEGRT